MAARKMGRIFMGAALARLDLELPDRVSLRDG